MEGTASMRSHFYTDSPLRYKPCFFCELCLDGLGLRKIDQKAFPDLKNLGIS